MNAIFAMYYTGNAGSGLGVVILRDGLIAGADAGGGIYDGNYALENGGKNLVGTVRLEVPPETGLVTGATSGQSAAVLEIPLSLPVDLAGGKTVPVRTTTGPVNVVFKKLRDLH